MGAQLRCLLWPSLLLMGRIDVPGDPLTTHKDLGGGTEVCRCPHCKCNGVPVLETVCPFLYSISSWEDFLLHALVLLSLFNFKQIPRITCKILALKGTVQRFCVQAALQLALPRPQPCPHSWV